jgi:hypothetical protein
MLAARGEHSSVRVLLANARRRGIGSREDGHAP